MIMLFLAGAAAALGIMLAPALIGLTEKIISHFNKGKNEKT